jgi:peroxiredoxin
MCGGRWRGRMGCSTTTPQWPKTRRIPLYLRAKRAWFVIDTAGIIRYVKTTEPRELIPNEEILKALSELK